MVNTESYLSYNIYLWILPTYLDKFDGVVIEGDGRSAGRNPEDLLATCVDNVHAQLIHLEGSAAQGSHSVHSEQGAIANRLKKGQIKMEFKSMYV